MCAGRRRAVLREKVRTIMRRLLRSAAAASAYAACSANAAATAPKAETKDTTASSQAVAAAYVETLATSDGQQYTLEYLDRSTRFSVWRGSNGERSTFSEMINSAAAQPGIVLVGETHYDAVGHKLEQIIFARLAAKRPVTLALEMFETDVQHVVDEYLDGLIREEDMLKDARPWANYATAYRPLVELARAAGLPVVAANAPRRYVSAAGRMDDATFVAAAWSPKARGDLPPLPLPESSAAYMAHLMADPEVVPEETSKSAEAGERSGASGGGCPHIGLTSARGLVEPMRLWDACMAHAIARVRQVAPSRLVVLICGSSHCEQHQGVADFLRTYAPSERPLVIAMYPEADCHRFVPERHLGSGDFVVLTDESASPMPTLHARAMPPPPPSPPPASPPALPLQPPSPLPAASPQPPIIGSPTAAVLPQPTATSSYQLQDFAKPQRVASPPRQQELLGGEMAKVVPAPHQQLSAANNSLSRAIFVLKEAAVQAGMSGLAVASLVYVAIGLAERTKVIFPTSFRRRGRLGLPMGGGLIAACLGAKYGVRDAIEKLDRAAVSERRS